MNNSISESDYFLKFGLEKDPFPIGVIDKNIFLTPEINRRLKQAKQYITEGQKLLIITSLSGAGKSLLAQKLVILKEADWRTSLLLADENMEAGPLSYSVIQHLLPEQVNDPEQAVSMLHKYLETSYREKIRPVIVIDDADKLSVETLQFVLQLADLRYNEALFRIVLFANESINETLSKVGLKELAEGTIDIMVMPGFTIAQIPAYLKYRFSSCGEGIEAPFTDNEIEYIYSASGGLPGGINLLSRKLMQDSLNKEITGNNFGSLSMLLSLFILALAGYLYYENLNLKNVQSFSHQQTEIMSDMEQNDEKILVKEEIVEQNELTALDESLSLKLSEILTLRTAEEIAP